MKFYSILVYVRPFQRLSVCGLRETGSNSIKRPMNRFRGWGGGDVIQNQTSPDFKFPAVSISDLYLTQVPLLAELNHIY